jgi:hypothetical protein
MEEWVMVSHVREVGPGDLEVVFGAYGGGSNSYALLNSMLGYSLSELKSEYGSRNPALPKEWIVEDEGGPLALVRLGPEDLISKTLRIQPFLISTEQAGRESVGRCMSDMIDQVRLYANTSRFYSFLLEPENAERQVLENNGFSLEAVLRSHVYVQGAYRNLLVFGKCFEGMR